MILFMKRWKGVRGFPLAAFSMIPSSYPWVARSIRFFTLAYPLSAQTGDASGNEILDEFLKFCSIGNMGRGDMTMQDKPFFGIHHHMDYISIVGFLS